MQTIGRFALLDALGELGRVALYEAYDPNLDRRVELHVLAAADAEPGDLASFKEAAASWSRLVHPGVARVHEIGTEESGGFVAVEAGRQTVAQWCEGSEASLERLAAMVDDALAGLVAAYDAGLVHGAVEDRSLIVGRDGRAKLSRFVLLAGSTNVSPSEDVAALCGAFARYGAKLEAPDWLMTPLREGQRDKDVNALRNALSRGAGRQSRWVSHALVASVAVATTAVAWRDAVGQVASEAEPCTAGAELLTEAWGPQRKADIEAAIMATGQRQRVGRWQELEGRFDRWTEAWTRSRLQACEATAASEVETAARQATLACLDDRRMQLEILSDAFARVDNDSFGKLFGESRVLPRPENCAYGDDREVPTKQAQDVGREMARAYALVLAQRPDEAEAIYREMGPRAEAIGFYQGATEAYRYAAVAARDRGEAGLAYDFAQRSLSTAEKSRDPVMIVRAWHRLASNAWKRGDAERAEFFIARALTRSEDEAVAAESRMELLTFEAQRLSASARPAEAAQRYLQVYEQVQRFGMEPLLGLQALTQASQKTAEAGDRARADELAERAIHEGTERYGSRHWIVAIAQAQLAQSALQNKDYATGLRWSSQAIEVELGDPMSIQAKGFATLMHADLLRAHDRTEEGRVLLAATLDELESQLAAFPQAATAMRGALARFATELGRPCDAADAAAPLVAQIEANPSFSPENLATELLNLANAQSQCGRTEQGLANLERGLALTEMLSGASARYRFEQQRRSGTIFDQLGEPARARQAYERALVLAEPVDVDPERLAWIRGEIARLSGSSTR